MFAITFDLTVAVIDRLHPKGVNRAYEEIRQTLGRHGFVWKQGSVYINPEGGLVELFQELNGLKALPLVSRVGARGASLPGREQLGVHHLHEEVNLSRACDS